MIKDRVGICRRSTYNLPATDHVYGYKAQTDAEGAGALISTWVTANPSEHKGAEAIVVYTNVLAIKHGCITARDMRQYAKDHPCIRMKVNMDTLQSLLYRHVIVTSYFRRLNWDLVLVFTFHFSSPLLYFSMLIPL